MTFTPELLRQVVGATEEKLHVINHRWNPSTLAYEVETVTSGGTGSDVNVTNPVLAVTASSLPLPTGAATAARQDTGNASLASIDGKLPAALGGAGGVKVEVVASSGGGLTDTELRAAPVPVSVAGVATAAKQDTGNTSLGSIDAKMPALGQALAAASVPIVLTAIQQGALTPPAAISGFALETGHLAAIDTASAASKTDLDAIKTSVNPIPADPAREGGNLAVIAAATALLATQATAAAEKADLDTIAANTTGIATSAKQDTLNASLTTLDTDLRAEIGAIGAKPDAYTVLDRLYQLGNKIDNHAKVGATEATMQKLLGAMNRVPAASAVRATLLHR